LHFTVELKKKKTGITRPRPDGGVTKNHGKKMGITRPRPDGGVKSAFLCFYVSSALALCQSASRLRAVSHSAQG